MALTMIHRRSQAFANHVQMGSIIDYHFPRQVEKDQKNYLQSDVCGKIETKSLGGAQHFLTFIDDKSRFVWAYVFKHKSEVFQKFTEWKAMVKNPVD